MNRPIENPSVIITCFNLERYISQAIESVLAQEFDAPVEIIVVDDCSTDGSADVIKRYEQVRYLRTPSNSGVLMATVAGMEAARGDLILFLDGDDLWEPTKLEQVCSRFASDSNLALVTHDLVYMGANGTILPRESLVHRRMSKAPVQQHGDMIRSGILQVGDFVWLGSAYAIRRSTADVSGFCAWAATLPDPRNTYQDWPLAYWVAAQPGAVLAYIAEKLFRYRVHGLNHSQDASSPQRAVRNFNRTLNTSLAMLDIVGQFDLPASARSAVRAQVAFNRYLVSLYSGRRLQAAAGFFGSLGYFRYNPKLVPKELARLIGIEAFGPARFTRLRQRTPS